MDALFLFPERSAKMIDSSIQDTKLLIEQGLHVIERHSKANRSLGLKTQASISQKWLSVWPGTPWSLGVWDHLSPTLRSVSGIDWQHSCKVDVSTALQAYRWLSAKKFPTELHRSLAMADNRIYDVPTGLSRLVQQIRPIWVHVPFWHIARGLNRWINKCCDVGSLHTLIYLLVIYVYQSATWLYKDRWLK